jgi:hypothetical protein
MICYPQSLVTSRNSRFIVGLLLQLFWAASAAAGETNPKREMAPRPALSGNSLFALVQQKAPPGEYLFQQASDGFSAVNTPNRLHVRFSQNGVSLRQWDAANKVAKGELLSLNFAAFGRTGALREMPKASPLLRGERVEFLRPGLTEWYRNTGKGFEQGFDVPVRPDGEGELCVLLQTDAAVEQMGENAIQLLAGQRKLSFTDLVVTDARGQGLNARLEVQGGAAIKICVDDRDATYPIVIDPTLGDAYWSKLFTDPGMPASVNAIALDSAGNVYVGGTFVTTMGNVAVPCVAKWDGFVWTPVGAGPGYQVLALAVDSAGNLYAGGDNIKKWDGSGWSLEPILISKKSRYPQE